MSDRRNHLNDPLYCKALVEAQWLMGHHVPSGTLDDDHRTVLSYDWDVDTVRQALHVPLTPVWDDRIVDLEVAGLTSFSWNVAPVWRDADGVEHEHEGWQDEPRENWGSLGITPHGVLRLAELYGRPYVRCEESRALLAHWQLVQAEAHARACQPLDEERWAREWPERHLAWQAWNQQYWDERNTEKGF